MKHYLPGQILPLQTDFTIEEDREGIECVYLWSKEGEGMGRIAMVYGECGFDCKDVAEFLRTAANAYYPLIEALAKELFSMTARPILGEWDKVDGSVRDEWRKIALGIATETTIGDQE